MFKRIEEFINYQQDKLIISKQNWDFRHKKISWRNPKTYNDHLVLSMINPQTKKLWIYTDKLEVRKYVEKKIGKHILNKVYKIYNSAREIDFESLPKQFALKTNHGSSWNIICNNKDKLDRLAWIKAKAQLDDWTTTNYYYFFREGSYKLIKPRIFLERYLVDKQGQLPDYKFFCWYGQVKFIQINTDRYTKNHKQTFFDLNWKRLPFHRYTPSSKAYIPPPSKLPEMLEIAAKLSNSKDFAHVRVDLYQVNNKIYFGKMTFTPGGGMYNFVPYKYEYVLGKYF